MIAADSVERVGLGSPTYAGVINKPPADPLSKPPVLDRVSKGELGQGRAGGNC